MATSRLSAFAALLPTLIFTISSSALAASEYVNFAFIDNASNKPCHEEINETYKTNYDDFSITQIIPPVHPLTEGRYATINDISLNKIINESNEKFNKSNDEIQNILLENKVNFDIEKAIQGFMSIDEKQTEQEGNSMKENNEFTEKTLNDTIKKIKASLQKNPVKKVIKNEKLSRNCHYQLNCNSQQYSYSITTVETVISKHIKEVSVKQFSPTPNRRFFERKEITKKLPPQKTVVEIITSY